MWNPRQWNEKDIPFSATTHLQASRSRSCNACKQKSKAQCAQCSQKTKTCKICVRGRFLGIRFRSVYATQFTKLHSMLFADTTKLFADVTKLFADTAKLFTKFPKLFAQRLLLPKPNQFGSRFQLECIVLDIHRCVNFDCLVHSGSTDLDSGNHVHNDNVDYDHCNNVNATINCTIGFRRWGRILLGWDTIGKKCLVFRWDVCAQKQKEVLISCHQTKDNARCFVFQSRF